MSEQVKDGGPAFPSRVSTVLKHSDGRKPDTTMIESGHLGLSLRDYFAAKAMVAEYITSSSDATPEATAALIEAATRAGQTPIERIAFNAYRMADAMLAAREGGSRE